MKSLKLALAWMVVALPLSWGVYHSVRKAMPLFQARPKFQPTLPIPDPPNR